MARIPEKFQLGLKKIDPKKAERLLEACFPAQLDFVLCQDKKISAICSRRGGKTTACAIKLLVYCLKNPNKTCLYLALTRESAIGILTPIVMELNAKFNLGIVAKTRPPHLKLPNGSKIIMVGCDDDSNQREKLRGISLGMVILDEAGSFRTNLKDLAEDILMPCLMDELGQLCLISTPGARHGFFYDVTTNSQRAPGWTNFRWHTLDNPHMVIKYNEMVAEKLRDNPLIEQTPAFKREFLGEWTDESDKLTYKFERNRNSALSLPTDRNDYIYTLSIDLGFEDDCSFIVGAYSLTTKQPCLYFIYAFKKPKMLMDEIAEKIREIFKEWKITKVVCDSSNKLYVKELEYRIGVAIEPAPKIQKWNFISMMNSDFITERIKLLPAAKDLEVEYLALFYDDSEPEKPKEISRCKDHCADAALYLWRSSFHYRAQGTIDVVDDFAERERKHIEKLSRRVEGADVLDFFFGE